MRRLAVLLLAGAVGASALSGADATTRTGVTKLAAASSGGTVTLSGWATFSGGPIASANDSSGDSLAAQGAPSSTHTAAETSGAELIGADLVYRPELADLFVRLRLKSMPTVGPLVGDPTVLYGLRTVVSGVPIELRMQSAGTTAQFGLFECGSETGCTQASATISGGYGTTGVEVVAAIPLSAFATIPKVHLAPGDKIGTPVAFTARAAFAAGAVDDSVYMDDLVLIKAAKVTIPIASVSVSIGKTTKKASLKNGLFSASFPASVFGGRSTATAVTKTCLGSGCVTQKWTVSR